MSQMNLGSRKGDWKMTRYFNTEGTRDAVEQSAFEKIYEVVRQIPYGQVATYGQVAALAGNNRWARVVGYALHANPDPDHIPCYRVVNKEGRVSDAFAFGGGNRQVELLQAEGVAFVDGHVDMERHQWERPAY
jgi:methylated-DNA-protein-cysteine methyltransferase-like protein